MVSDSWPCVFFDVLGVFRVGSFQLSAFFASFLTFSFVLLAAAGFCVTKNSKKLIAHVKMNCAHSPVLTRTFGKYLLPFLPGVCIPIFVSTSAGSRGS